jgi:transcriptional regulator of arginine metabolism
MPEYKGELVGNPVACLCTTVYEPRHMATRELRRSLVKRIVQEHRVGSQAELVDKLRARGVDCTQATLSRDLRDMGIVRRVTPSGPAYTLEQSRVYAEAVRRVVGMEILDIQHNESLVVIRTLVGRAQGVAAFIDSWDETRILGTVAGDDTVFVAPRHVRNIAELTESIRRLETVGLEDSAS